MKLYIFTLDHLSTVQKGIQAAHVVAELMLDGPEELDETVNEWALNHKTIIMVQGGNYNNLKNLEDLAVRSTFPTAVFYEDIETLGGLTTAVAVILPMVLPTTPSEYFKLTANDQILFNKCTSAKKVIV